MDFEPQIIADKDSLIADIKKLVSINSAEAEAEGDMPFGRVKRRY